MMDKGFKFEGYLNPTKVIYWNPDTAQNGHLMITGGSGAGKTRLAKVLISYLHHNRKNIHIIDIQDTLGISDVPERVFKFEVRNSKYSINPFEFLLDEKNGGPNAQVDDIMEMFRKTFMKRLKSAPNMSAVLRRLIIDSYRKSGIIDDDPTTWGFGLNKAQMNDHLPIISDMKDLVDYILDYVSSGYGAKFGSIVSKHGKIMNDWHIQTAKLKDELKKLDEVADRDEELANKERERLVGEIEGLKAHIDNNKESLVSYFRQYIDFYFLEGSIPAYEALQTEGEGYGWLDYKFYSDKDRLKAIRTIETYLQALSGAGVFGRSTPDISLTEINRYDLSSIKDESQLFAADTLVSKLFRMVYLRGEYRSLPEGNTPYKTRLPGTTTDTCIVIDEMQALLPDTSSEANLKGSLYNKFISQARNFGAMAMVMSQSPANFPELYHTNVGTKIILHTAPNDIPKVRQVTAIKDVNLFKHLEHRNKDGHYDVALMKDRAGEWTSVRLPWYSE
jgi:energy-coupling factor transporter ATP-binding protein EcfA2